MNHRTKQILIALDQLINTFIGGWADETLSARAHRAYVAKTRWGLITRPIINKIFFWQQDHCLSSYNNERKRAHTEPEYREIP